MTPGLVLEIIRLSLELAIKIHDDIPADQRQQFWIDHARRMQFWNDLFVKLQGG